MPRNEGLGRLAQDAYLDGSSERAILAQERRGAEALAQAAELPKPDAEARAVFEGWGIVFGEPIDDLFVRATLPPGWTKTCANASAPRHMLLLDDQGRRRASIFYKAASYDRCANISPLRRYGVSLEPADGWEGSRTLSWEEKQKRGYVGLVTQDGEAVIWRSEPIPGDSGQASAAAGAWLDANRPDWRDYGAYWAE